jgi:hypothetical protein
MTASSRLAAMMGVPYILVESADQVCGYGLGQEGIRRRLADTAPSKTIIGSFQDCQDDCTRLLSVVEKAIDEVESNNWNHLFVTQTAEDAFNQFYKDGKRVSMPQMIEQQNPVAMALSYNWDVLEKVMA